MTPVYQTEHYAGKDWRQAGRLPGNCAQAAVASLFDLSLVKVPHFAAEIDPGPSDWRAMRRWARGSCFDFAWADPRRPDHAGYIEDLYTITMPIIGPLVLASVAVLGHAASDYGEHMVVWDLSTHTIAHNPTRFADPNRISHVTELIWPTAMYDPDPDVQYARALAG